MTAPIAALASRADRHPWGPGWLYERKLDGERCLATRGAESVVLHGRSGRDITGSFPGIVEALLGQDTPDYVIDGEAVVFDGERTSFDAIQPLFHTTDPDAARATGIVVTYVVFDVLEIDGVDTRRLPLTERKGLLADLLSYADPIQRSDYVVDASATYLADACRCGWEGLIAKRVKAAYPSGRTHDWVKLKCERQQEFVVGGWTEPQGSRSGFGALLLGYFEGAELLYAGKVGTGFSAATLRLAREALAPLREATSPFAPSGPRPPERGVTWTAPLLVVQVSFAEWTPGGQLRHPRFLGFRRDKDAAEVVRE